VTAQGIVCELEDGNYFSRILSQGICETIVEGSKVRQCRGRFETRRGFGLGLGCLRLGAGNEGLRLQTIARSK